MKTKREQIKKLLCLLALQQTRLQTRLIVEQVEDNVFLKANEELIDEYADLIEDVIKDPNGLERVKEEIEKHFEETGGEGHFIEEDLKDEIIEVEAEEVNPDQEALFLISDIHIGTPYWNEIKINGLPNQVTLKPTIKI